MSARKSSVGRVVRAATKSAVPPAARSAPKAPGRDKAPVSLHQRILADIQHRILSGEWPPGYRIPFEHELMIQYNCSRMTVSKVLTQLASARMIERRRKAGSFVSRPHSQSAVLDIPDIKAEVQALGLPYSFEILERHKRRSNRDDRELLDESAPVPVLELICRHCAGDEPFCFEERIINLTAVPEAEDAVFTEVAPGSWLLRQVPWTMAEHRIRATEASGAAAKALRVRLGVPCLVIERKTRSANHGITFVRLTYVGSAHELVASFAPEASKTASVNGT
jgi:GntR family histidine utilization transcriptional repressor